MRKNEKQVLKDAVVAQIKDSKALVFADYKGVTMKDFDKMLEMYDALSPLRRNVSLEEVGKSAIYLLSDMSTGVTGDIHFVDSGYNVIAMPHPQTLKTAGGSVENGGSGLAHRHTLSGKRAAANVARANAAVESISGTATSACRAINLRTNKKRRRRTWACSMARWC